MIFHIFDSKILASPGILLQHFCIIILLVHVPASHYKIKYPMAT